MTRNLPLPAEHGANDELWAGRTELFAVPDDPDDTQELTFLPAAAAPDQRTTAWLTCDVDDAVELRAMR